MRRIKMMPTLFYEIPEDAAPQTRWLLNLMNEYDLNKAELADMIHVSRQAVTNWVYCLNKISFGNICAICYTIDKHSDPDNLYRLFNEG